MPGFPFLKYAVIYINLFNNVLGKYIATKID